MFVSVFLSLVVVGTRILNINNSENEKLIQLFFIQLNEQYPN